MKGEADSSALYEVERPAYHAVRPGFRIAELQISPAQKVPWHYHNNIHDEPFGSSCRIQKKYGSPRDRPIRCPRSARTLLPTPVTCRLCFSVLSP